MNSNIKTLLRVFGSFVFVIFSVLVGRFLLPFVTWSLGWRVIAALTACPVFLCLAGFIIAWRKRSAMIAYFDR